MAKQSLPAALFLWKVSHNHDGIHPKNYDAQPFIATDGETSEIMTQSWEILTQKLCKNRS